MSEDRIKIYFDVDSSDLEQLKNAAKTLDNFNRNMDNIGRSAGTSTQKIDSLANATERMEKKQINLTDAARKFDTMLGKQHFNMNAVQQAQNALSGRLEKFGRDVKVAIDQSGKFSAELKNMQGQTIKYKGTMDLATNSLENMTTQIKTTKNQAQLLEKQMREARKEAEKLRGVDLTHRLPKDGSDWDVKTHPLSEYGRIIDASMDKNNRFKQTLVNAKGELIKITGYFDKATNKIVEYDRAVGAASGRQLAAGGFDRAAVNLIGQAADSMKGLNKYTLSWNEAMGIAGIRMLQWTAVSYLIFGVQEAFVSMLQTIIEVDTQMTELKKVMSEDTDFRAVLQTSIDLATILGRKVTDINEAMIEFGRQGLNADDIEKMAKATTLLANVGDIDAGEAASRLTGILTIFKKDYIEATDVVDRFNEVQNNYATTVEILTDAVKRSGGTAAAFGVSLEENIGHTTAIGEATRESGAIIGNSLKTIYSRITTLGPAIDVLADVGVNVFDPMTEQVRPVNDILKELAGKWDGLTDSQRQNIGVQVAGRNQLTRFLALMDNYETALSATATASESYGSAVKENDTYMESMQASINILWASLQELAIVLGENGVGAAFLIAVEGATKLVNGITRIVDTLGAFSLVIPVSLGLVGAMAVQFVNMKNNIGLLEQGIAPMNNNIKTMGERMGMSSTNAMALSGAITNVNTGLKNMALATFGNPFFWVILGITAITTLIGHYKQLEAKQEQYAASTKTAREEFEAFKKSIDSGTVDDYTADKFKKRVEDLRDLSVEITKNIDNEALSLKTLQASEGYSTLGTSIRNFTKDKEALVEEYGKETKLMDVLSDKQLEAAAAAGIEFDKNTTLAEFQEQNLDLRKRINDSIEESREAHVKMVEQAIIPTTEAYFEMSVALDENSTALENAMGFGQKFVESIKEQKAIIEILSGVKEKDATQTQLMAGAEAFLADLLGVSTEEFVNNRDTYLEAVEDKAGSMEKMLEVAQKTASGEVEAGELADLQALLSAENAEKTKAREAAAAEDASKTIRIEYDKIRDKLLENEITMYDTAQANEKAQADLAIETGRSMGDIRNQYDTTGVEFDSFAKNADSNAGDVESSMESMAKNTAEELIVVIAKLSDFKDEWDLLKDSLSKTLIGRVTVSIKGLWDGLFGGGGEINQRSLSDAITKDTAGSIAGGGFAGLRFTSGFGARKHPLTGMPNFHSGIDLAGPMGTPIRARQGGVVTYSGAMGGYGNIVIIQGSNGLEYRYAHNSQNYVQMGQPVSAGSTIAAMGSTGMSTGPHLHFEVRRGGVPINPSAYYHGGGIVSKAPKRNEIDARLQVGEMVINKSQQKRLFDLMNKKKPNDTWGAGGPTHTVKRGETFSHIAEKYFGNAYKDGITRLKKLNPKLSNIASLSIGQKINVPSTSSKKPSSSKGSTKKVDPKKAAEAREKYIASVQNKFNNKMDWIDQAEHMGIRADGYRVRQLTTKDSRGMYETLGKKSDYNKMVFDGLSDYKNANDAKKLFKQANPFLSATDKAAALKNILKEIGQNVLQDISTKTNTWLENFNKGVKESSTSVKAMVDLSKQVNDRKSDEKRSNYIDKYTADLYKKLGIKGESQDPLDAMKSKADELKSKIDSRAEESADLKYRLSSNQLAPRLKELEGYRKKVQDQMKKVEAEFRGKGITDKSLIDAAKSPLADKLKEITTEYNELKYAMDNGKKTLSDNEKELKKLADEYNKLQDEIKKSESKREYTDVWGNIVRDAEGNVKKVIDQGADVIRLFSDVKAEVQTFNSAVMGGGINTIANAMEERLSMAVEAISPTLNAQVMPSSAVVNNNNSENNENRIYEANTNVNRNVTYVVQAGVVLASESELKEFARLIKDLIEEEEGRGN